MKSFDVAIIGAGPAGSSTAYHLSNCSGLKVALFEKDEYAGKNNICAGGISKSKIDEMKIPNIIIEKRIKHIDVFLYGKKVRTDSPEINLVTVKREKFDRYLSEEAENAGAELYLNTKIINIKKSNKKWKVISKKDEFYSRIVVFADGPVSRIRKKYNIGFHPDLYNCSIGVIKEVSCDNPPSIIELFFDNKVSIFGYGWQFPKKDLLNIGVAKLLKYSEKLHIKKGLDFVFKKYINDRYDFGKTLREAYALIPCGFADNVSKNGLLCVGDAGGFVSPFTGGGLDSAIDSGRIAANVIFNIFKNNDMKILNNYTNELLFNTWWYSAFKKEEKIMRLLKKSPSLYQKFFDNYLSP